MSKSRPRKKISAFIVAVITVAVALSYLLGGDGIEQIINKIAESPYGIFAEIFSRTPDGEIEIHVIDVDQGDSILIRSSDGNILIDCGTNDSEAALKFYLDSCKIEKIDYLICSHPHDDHIGGADMIIDNYEIDCILMTDMEYNNYSFEKLLRGIERKSIYAEIPALGGEYTLGDISFKILGPVTVTDDANNMSLVVKLTYGENTFLFTGDAEKDEELSVLEYFGKDELDCDFYKVGHHGSNTSSCKEFLDAVSPDIAAISVGYENDYGHPRGEVLDRLKKASCNTVLRTDKIENIVLSSDGRNITVLTDWET